MPTHRFKWLDTGEVEDINIPVEALEAAQLGPDIFEIGGRKARRLWVAAPRAETEWARPIHSDALGVHPSQVNAFRQAAARAGVPTDFDSKARPILRSREHRRRYLRHRGVIDGDGGYGD